MIVAAVDCGTNSIRLLVADAHDGRLETLRRELRIVRLGAGVGATGEFTAAALDRTFAACAEYARIIADCGAERVRFVATSAARDAGNRVAFARGVAERMGVEPDVISGDEEARLSFRGATTGLSELAAARPPYLVVDIGGGSTEFVLGGDGTADRVDAVVAARSVDVGCVRLTERHLCTDPPSPHEVAAAVLDVDAGLEQARATVPLAKAMSVVGVAGTVTTVAAAALDLDRYDRSRLHHSVLSSARIHGAAGMLLALPRAGLAALPYMHPGRVDVIGAGALILDRVLAAVPGVEELVVSETDILDAIAGPAGFRVAR